MSATLESLQRHAVATTLRLCASDAAVNPDALLDSSAFHAATQDLDPAAPTFSSDIRAAAEAAADREPGRFRTGMQAPLAQSSTAAGSGPRQWTMDDVGRASNAEVLDAIKAGHLRDLGVPPPKGGAHDGTPGTQAGACRAPGSRRGRETAGQSATRQEGSRRGHTPRCHREDSRSPQGHCPGSGSQTPYLQRRGPAGQCGPPEGSRSADGADLEAWPPRLIARPAESADQGQSA